MPCPPAPRPWRRSHCIVTHCNALSYCRFRNLPTSSPVVPTVRIPLAPLPRPWKRFYPSFGEVHPLPRHVPDANVGRNTAPGPGTMTRANRLYLSIQFNTITAAPDAPISPPLLTSRERSAIRRFLVPVPKAIKHTPFRVTLCSKANFPFLFHNSLFFYSSLFLFPSRIQSITTSRPSTSLRSCKSRNLQLCFSYI